MATQQYGTEAGEAKREQSGVPAVATPVARSSVERLERAAVASLAVIAIAVVLIIAYNGRLVFIPLFTAVLLAFMLAPIVDLMEKNRVPRALGAFFAVVVLLGALYALSYFSYARAAAFAQELPRYTRQIRESLVSFQQQAESLQKTTEAILPADQESPPPVRIQQEQSWTEVLTKSAASLTEIIFVISFIPFLVYFMLTWQDHVRTATVMLFSMENRNTAYVTLGLISAMIRRFIVGNAVIGGFLAVVSIFVFWLLNLPYFYFIGLISGFLSLVPYLGVVLALLPPLVAGLGVMGGTELLIIVLTVFSLHLFALNVLYPKLLGRQLQLNPLVVTIALLTWGWLWGGMGLILAVPITGAMKIIFDHVESLRSWGAWLGE